VAAGLRLSKAAVQKRIK
jgi:hypothetical protein